MNANELFDRRAERGRTRGAAEVWADAQHELHSEQPLVGGSGRTSRRRSVVGFRLAFAAIAIGALALLADPFGSLDDETADVSQPITDETEAVEVAEVVPAQFLIEGMTLDTIHEPDDGRPLVGPGTDNVTYDAIRAALSGAQLWVFTDRTDPLDNRILIGTVSDGREGLAAINGTLESSESIVEFSNGAWQVVGESDYVLAAQFDSPDQVRLNAWELGFRDDADESAEAMWQAASHDGADEWFWIVRLFGGATTLRPIEILGRSGVEMVEPDGNNQVVWTEGEVAFRLTASSVDAASRLVEVTDDEWDAAVANANDSSFGVESVQVPIGDVALVLFGLSVLAGVGFLIWRNRTPR